MNIDIKHRYTENVLFACDADNMKDAVIKAKKSGADLRGADLRGADLYGADLRGADLSGANLYGEKLEKTPLIIYNLTYWCVITEKHMKLGCKVYTHNEWSNFNDDEISEMDSKALGFCKVWKEPLLTMCKTHKG